MRAVDIIRKKRDGEELSRQEIEFLVQGYVRGSVPDYQMAAFCMAVLFRSMNAEETGHLTRAMIDSGETLDLGTVEGPFVDKHSTGGVGDKVSIVLAPMVAACGARVPMMSGRGLGHTGGTLDKLESIPGYRTRLDAREVQVGLRDNGYVMVGQSDSLVPADRLMYALRDVTATVESIPLITSSIMSKKFAEGADSLVLDVKCGSGAFMKSPDDALALAQSLVCAGRALDRRVAAIITDMEAPLGRAVGNFLEISECIDCLHGEGPQDLMDLTFRLGGWMLLLADLAPTVAEGEQRCRRAVDTGDAWECFVKNVRFQGGDPSIVEDPSRAPRAPITRAVEAVHSGAVAGIDAYAVGHAGVILGAGRARKEDSVRPEVGVVLKRNVGESVHVGDELCTVYAADEDDSSQAAEILLEAFRLAEGATLPGSRILREVYDE